MSFSPSYIFFRFWNKLRGTAHGIKNDRCDRNKILQTYSKQPFADSVSKKTVIFMCDGKMYHGGLADRLRGLVTVYQACQRAGARFCIYFLHPFELQNYLVPNTYDWRIDDADIQYNIDESIPLVWHQRSPYFKFNDRFYRQIKSLNFRQFHYYTNSDNSYNNDFGRSFNELFKPSAKLQQHIDNELNKIDGYYIALHFRFLKLLDDFNEVFGIPLSNEAEREELIEKCLAEIHRIKARFSAYDKFLLCSDSTKFIAAARKIGGIFVTDGEVTHSGNSENSSFDAHLKTFLDFYLLSKANRIISVATGKMLSYSGFSYCAARIGNVEFERDNF